MLRRALCGDAHAVGLGGADEFDRLRARDVQHVITTARESGQREISCDDRRLRFRGAARDAEPGRPGPFVHVAPAHERRVLGVLREHRAGECAQVFERAAHDTAVGDAVAVVGEHPHPEVVQLPHRGQLLTPPPLRDAAGDVHVARAHREAANRTVASIFL